MLLGGRPLRRGAPSGLGLACDDRTDGHRGSPRGRTPGCGRPPAPRGGLLQGPGGGWPHPTMRALEPTEQGRLTVAGYELFYEVFGRAGAPNLLLLPTWQIAPSRHW